MARPGQPTRRPSVGQTVKGVVSKALAIFVSPITVWLGNWRLIRLEGQMPGKRSTDRTHRRSAARCFPSFFHRLQFDWATGGLFVLEVRREQAIRGDGQYIWSAAIRLSSLFHRLQFDWATGCFPLPRVGVWAAMGPGASS
jgi:hypothetical protein